jgi:hypothetical protein
MHAVRTMRKCRITGIDQPKALQWARPVLFLGSLVGSIVNIKVANGYLTSEVRVPRR